MSCASESDLFYRTTRWLDRCIAAHARPSEQNLFPIVQGGLDPELRKESVRQLTQRDVAGFAIGGLRYALLSAFDSRLRGNGTVDNVCGIVPESRV